MNSSIDHIYISPHLDDAVCSCGGSIREQTMRGENVLVVTLFTAGAKEGQTLPPYLRMLHLGWGFDLTQDPFKVRRLEDIAALDLLGAEHLHLGMQGALYRQRPDGRHLYSGLQFLGRPVLEDQALLARIRQTLTRLRTRHPNAVFYAPLGAGGHVDHRLVHKAARNIPGEVRFYEDIPYVFLDRMAPLTFISRWLARMTSPIRPAQKDATDNTTFDDRIHRVRWKLQEWARYLGGPQITLWRNPPPRSYHWQSVLQSIELPAKIDSMMQYTSQFRMLFGSQAQASKALASYTSSIRRDEINTYERLWRMTLHL